MFYTLLVEVSSGLGASWVVSNTDGVSVGISGHVKLPPTFTKGVEYSYTTYPFTDTFAPGVHENPTTISSLSIADVCDTARPGVL